MKEYLPHSKGCYCCGESNPKGLKIRFYKEESRVVTEFIGKEEHQSYPGRIHGGILCSLLDETMGWAPVLQTGLMSVTGELNFRFLKPAPLHQKLFVIGEVEKVNKRLYFAKGRIEDELGNIYITAQGKYVPMSEEQTRDVDTYLLYPPDSIRIFEK